MEEAVNGAIVVTTSMLLIRLVVIHRLVIVYCAFIIRQVQLAIIVLLDFMEMQLLTRTVSIVHAMSVEQKNVTMNLEYVNVSQMLSDPTVKNVL